MFGLSFKQNFKMRLNFEHLKYKSLKLHTELKKNVLFWSNK